ncbi:hypothetical protein C8F04DRAFT_1005782 [Mycena alexandri]|uniref:EthD domain-containing protein n=1 Tax=Mycena alexandri TaxID=1745969 RepID=A0AAD6WYW0_9AGAR|nr:hypothetical protein C8F04DRAFT_1005782 [Mycena alexandri]
MSFRTDRVRLVVLIKKKPSLSKKEFHQHWAKTHGALFSSLEVVKKNILRYEQAHTNETVLSALAQQAVFPVSDWDGMGIFEAESYAKIFEVFQSDEYKKNVIQDEECYLDRDATQMLPLDLLSIIDQ